MDSKADGEEIIYPYLCFSVDNFDEAFEDIQVAAIDVKREIINCPATYEIGALK